MDRSAATGFANGEHPAERSVATATVALARIDADGGIVDVADGWVPTARHPRHLAELVIADEPGGLEHALEAAQRDGSAAFAGRLAATGQALAVEVHAGAGPWLVLAAPRDPGPLAAHAVARLAGAGLALIDTAGEHLFVNEAYCRIHGRDAAELLGARFTELFRESDRARAAAHHEAVLRRQCEGEPLELVIARGDGQPITIDSCSRRLELPDGTVLRLATVFDITAIRSTQDRLAEAESRLADITSSMPGAVYQLVREPSGDYRLTHMSEGLRELAGLDADASIDDFETIVGLLPSEDARRAIESAEASAHALASFEQEFPVDGPGGRRWIQARSQPHRQANGAVVWNGLMIDITERRRAEERLAASEHRLQVMAGSLPGAIYQFVHRADGGHELRYMSEGLRAICGLPEELELADFDTFLGLVPETERPALLEAIRRSEDTLEPLHHEFRLLGPGRAAWVEARSIPQPQANGELVCNGLLVDVTERRRARAEAERLNAILDSTPDCVVVTDPEGRILYLNEGGRRLLELGADEPVTGRDFLGFLAIGDAERLRREAAPAAARRGTWSGETTVVTGRGNRRPVSQTVLCQRDHAGRVDRFATVIRDLSERVAMETELRASEEGYRFLYHHTPTLLHSIDAEGRLTAVSDYWLERLGYEREAVIGRPSLDFFTTESRERALTEIRPAFWRDGYVRNIPFRVVCADHAVLDVLLSADCQYGDDGRVIQAVSVMTDVTERVAAERKLAASEERLRSLYHNTPVMMHSIDALGRIVDVNDYWLQHLGYAREQVIGARSRDFLSAASRDKAWRLDMPRLLEHGYLRDEPLEIVRADGEVLDILLSATLERDQRGGMQYSRTVMIDVTEQRRAEADYRDIFDNATEGIYRSTPEGRLLRANPALARLHGYASEAELFANVGDIEHDWYVDRGARRRLMQLLERDDRVTDFEAEIVRRATGERLWTSENVRTIRDRNGAVRYYEGTVRDISAQYRAARLGERRSEILEMIARDQPLDGVLHEVVATVEQQYPRLAAAVLRLQDERLHVAAAPSLAAPCIEAVDGRRPAAIGGAIEDAAGEPADASRPEDGTSALARAIRAAGYGDVLAAPVKDQRGAVLAVLAAFGDAAAAGPDPRDAHVLLNEMAQITAIAIEQDRLAQQLLHQARYDELTGLPNRTLLHDRLEQRVRETARSGERIGVLLLDLDEFKLVNDTLGHSAGDELLREVAARLRHHVRSGGAVARLGGDEFVLVIRLGSDNDASDIATRIIESLQASVRVAGHDVHARPSIGISICPQDGDAPEPLLQAADTAMYAAKHAGKNHYRFFAESMNTRISERLRIEGELRTALNERQLRLHFQPQHQLADGRLVGTEALVRWQHPGRGLLLPGEFLPVAERGPLIGEIDRFVLATACEHLAGWQAAGHRLTLGVNLSARELHADGFGEEMERILARTRVDPADLELEITESVLMHDFEHAGRQLADLKARAPGLKVAIDDFGSGYSSLNYLRHLPIDTLKIDRAFIADIDDADAADTARAIVRTIVELGRSLGLTVIAEGIETAGQASVMTELGCECGQGHWFEHALALADFERRLAP